MLVLSTQQLSIEGRVCEERDCGYLSAVFFSPPLFRSAIRAYLKILCVKSKFLRQADTHLHLAVIHRQRDDFSTSFKHRSIERLVIREAQDSLPVKFQRIYLVIICKRIN